MPLTRALYHSKAVIPVNQSVEAFLSQLVLQSRANSNMQSITGCLIFAGTHFLQVIEGPRMPLSKTMQSIMADRRHTDIGLIDLRVIPQRRFQNWAMFSVDYDEMIDKIIAQQVNAEKVKTSVFDADQIVSIIQFMTLHRECGALDVTSVAKANPHR